MAALITLVIERFFPSAVLDDPGEEKGKRARELKGYIRQTVKLTGGKVTKIEVLGSRVYMDVTTRDAADAIRERFGLLEGVRVSEADPLLALFQKVRPDTEPSAA